MDEAVGGRRRWKRPPPPIMIGGSGEQLTMRAVARLGDACNLFGPPEMVGHKLAVLQQHCETEGRNYAEVEKTDLTSLVLAREDAAVEATRALLGLPHALRRYR